MARAEPVRVAACGGRGGAVMRDNYPPGVTGTEEQIVGSAGDIYDRVFDYLNQQRIGAGPATIARALRLTEYQVDLALDRLCDTGAVRMVRRTRTGEVYGVTPTRGDDS